MIEITLSLLLLVIMFFHPQSTVTRVSEKKKTNR